MLKVHSDGESRGDGREHEWKQAALAGCYSKTEMGGTRSQGVAVKETKGKKGVWW